MQGHIPDVIERNRCLQSSRHLPGQINCVQLNVLVLLHRQHSGRGQYLLLPVLRHRRREQSRHRKPVQQSCRQAACCSGQHSRQHNRNCVPFGNRRRNIRRLQVRAARQLSCQSHVLVQQRLMLPVQYRLRVERADKFVRCVRERLLCKPGKVRPWQQQCCAGVREL